jgi:hypothetical protein
MHPLEAVVSPGFLENFKEHGCRRNDFILVLAAEDSDKPESALLMVDHADKTGVHVRLLISERDVPRGPRVSATLNVRDAEATA